MVDRRKVDRRGARPATAIGKCSVCGKWILRREKYTREARRCQSRNGGSIEDREMLVCGACGDELYRLREQAREQPVRMREQVHRFCGESWPVKSRR